MSTRWEVLPADSAPARAGAHQARIGDRMIIWSGDEGAPADDRRLARSELSLVTQVGRAFQDAHPRVPVLLDHGRHLVIDGGRSLRPAVDTCWRVEPLLPDTTVVDRPVRRAEPPDPAVAELVAAVSRAPYQADVTWLAQLPTRHSLSDGFRLAADRATAALAALGYTTSRFPITVGGGPSSNVIAERAGSGSAGVVLVTAHLDSINIAGGPAAPAPGADDNGSGSAGVLALARILATRSWQHDLRLICSVARRRACSAAGSTSRRCRTASAPGSVRS